MIGEVKMHAGSRRVGGLAGVDVDGPPVHGSDAIGLIENVRRAPLEQPRWSTFDPFDLAPIQIQHVSGFNHSAADETPRQLAYAFAIAIVKVQLVIVWFSRRAAIDDHRARGHAHVIPIHPPQVRQANAVSAGIEMVFRIDYRNAVLIECWQ